MDTLFWLSANKVLLHPLYDLARAGDLTHTLPHDYQNGTCFLERQWL